MTEPPISVPTESRPTATWEFNEVVTEVLEEVLSGDEFHAAVDRIMKAAEAYSASSSLLPVGRQIPIPLNDKQQEVIQDWADNNSIEYWGSSDAREHNLTIFARQILALASLPVRESTRDLLREALPYIESGVKREIESAGSHQEFKDEAIDLLRRCKSAISTEGLGESRSPLQEILDLAEPCLDIAVCAEIARIAKQALVESREPLPPPIVMKGVMCGHPDCPCTGGYLHDPKDLLPSVPAEIESAEPKEPS